jgi:hypothetical protein
MAGKGRRDEASKSAIAHYWQHNLGELGLEDGDLDTVQCFACGRPHSGKSIGPRAWRKARL